MARRSRISRDGPRPRAARRLHVAPGIGRVVEQAEPVDALERRLYRVPRVTFPLEPPPQIVAGIGAELQSSEARCGEGRFDVGCGRQPLVELGIDGPSRPPVPRRRRARRERPRTGHHRSRGVPCPAGEDPARRRDGGQWASTGYSSVARAPAPTPTGARMPSSSLTFPSTSVMSTGLSRRKSLAFSRPWPMRWSP